MKSKSVFLGIGMGVILSLSLSSILFSSEKKGTRGQDAVVSLTPVADFGIIKSLRESLVVRVPIGNHGDKAVVIKSVYVGCGCLAAKVENKTEISPGEIGYVNVRLNGEKVREGAHKHELLVQFRSEEIEALRIPVVYDYQPDISIVGRKVFIQSDLERMNGDSRCWGEAELNIVSHVLEPIVVESLMTTSPFLECISVSRDTDAGVDLIIRLLPGAPVGMYDEAIVVSLNHEEYRDWVVPVRCGVVGRVNLVPKKIIIRGLDLGAEFFREVKVAAPEKLVLSDVHVVGDGITVLFEPGEIESEGVLKVSGCVPPGKQAAVELYFEQPVGEKIILEILFK